MTYNNNTNYWYISAIKIIPKKIKKKFKRSKRHSINFSNQTSNEEGSTLKKSFGKLKSFVNSEKKIKQKNNNLKTNISFTKLHRNYDPKNYRDDLNEATSQMTYTPLSTD